MPLIMTLQQVRSLKAIAVIVCLFFLSWWLLDHIRMIGIPSPEFAGVKEDDASNPDDNAGDDGLAAKGRTQQVEELSERRERLEQGREDARNQVERLKRRLAALTPKLDELRSFENTLDSAWNTLESADQEGTRFTESIVQDYLALRRQRKSVVLDARVLSERSNMLDAILRQFSGEDIGTASEKLTPLVSKLENDVEGLTRTHREAARQVERLTERARSRGSHGGTLSDAVANIESSEVAPELVKLCTERETENTAECDRYLQGLVERTKKEAEDLASRQRSSSAAEVGDVRIGMARILTAHNTEQEQLDGDVESKQAAVAFERDRAKIEHYLVPFIALKRTYTTPTVMDDEIKDFIWVDIPIERAASLSEITRTGVFEMGADRYERLGPYLSNRLKKDIHETMLPFGQSWSYRDANYLVIARELLMNHGRMMVEEGLLRP